VTVKELMHEYKAGDKLAVEIIEQQADYLASGLVAAIHLLNPQVIVIGGGIADGGGKQYVQLISDKLRPRVFSDAFRGLKIVKAQLGNKAGFIGAAVQKEKLSA
jgi:glucokinase